MCNRISHAFIECLRQYVNFQQRLCRGCQVTSAVLFSTSETSLRFEIRRGKSSSSSYHDTRHLQTSHETFREIQKVMCSPFSPSFDCQPMQFEILCSML